MAYLNVSPNSSALPATAICPICKTGKMLITHDPCQNGAWFSCNSCEKHGDMLSLVATTLKLSENSALVQLAKDGLIANGLNHAHLLVKRAKQHGLAYGNSLALLNNATAGGKTVINANSLHDAGKTGLSIEPGLSWAARTTGRYFGWANADRIEDGLSVKRQFNEGDIHKKLTKHVMPVHCPAAFVFPFFDVPGRVSSFSLLLPGQKKLWQTIDAPVGYATDTGTYLEGGVFVHPEIVHTPGKILLTDEFELAVRLQLKHFSQYSYPLPVGVYKSTEPVTNSWGAIARKELVFWSSKISPQSLRLAIENDALMSASGTECPDVEVFVKNTNPKLLVEKALETAKHWSDVVRHFAAKWPLDKLLAFVASADLELEELHKLISQCPSSVAKKVKDELISNSSFRTIRAGSGRVEQRTTGLYYVDNEANHLIINAPFRFTHAVVSHKNGDLDITYRGDAIFRNRKVDLVVPKEQFDKAPIQSVVGAIVDQGAGMPTYNLRFNSHVANAINVLHPPEVLLATDKVGPSDKGYALPKHIFTYAHKLPLDAHTDDTDFPYFCVGKHVSRYITKTSVATWSAVHIAVFRQFVVQLLQQINGDTKNLIYYGDAASLAVNDFKDWLNLDESKAANHTSPIFVKTLRNDYVSRPLIVKPDMLTGLNCLMNGHLGIVSDNYKLKKKPDLRAAGRLIYELMLVFFREQPKTPKETEELVDTRLGGFFDKETYDESLGAFVPTYESAFAKHATVELVQGIKTKEEVKNRAILHNVPFELIDEELKLTNLGAGINLLT